MEIPLGLTFDDVLLVPRRTSIESRRGVETNARFTRRIGLRAPIVSANMDTVTESAMAIAMARAGAIGVLHRFLTISQQVEEVHRVKRAESLVIDSPHTIGPASTVGEAREFMRRVGISGLPVVGLDGVLTGLLTRRDIRFEDDRATVAQTMTPRDRLVTALTGTTVDEAREILRRARKEKLPLVDADGRLRGLMTAGDLARALSPGASADARGRLLAAAAVGVKADFLERAEALVAAGCDALIVDIAHGHS
ncbi:MAG: IMP dehydrogenase, partial [Polyangiaceae bacterium]